MARTNKYASVNFNHVFDKNISNSTSSHSTNSHPSQHRSATSFYSTISSPNSPNNLFKTHLPSSSTRTHGRMLAEPESDRISLRPLGRTGAGSIASSPVLGQEKQKEVGASVGSPKSDKFVPPHLRPGFIGREERPGPEVFRGKEVGQRQQQQFFGSPDRVGVEGRPKSGGYEMMRRGDGSNLGFVNRPISSGNRPGSSGWYGSC
uniref:Uncharacterized protein n=1 Tax=Salix viminalis TaxID=40686 RepID=A0A6N2LTK6_SALVM